MSQALKNEKQHCKLISSPLAMMPVQWSQFKDIDDVEPINNGDVPCLMEVREVLKKHGKRDRLGIALLHRHFDLSDDEAMVETSDEATRTLTLRPHPLDAVSRNDVGTIFKLNDGEFETMSWCRTFCQRIFLSHLDAHNRED